MNDNHRERDGTEESDSPEETRNAENRPKRGAIVVGVDGSAGSGTALDWVVMVRQPPHFYSVDGAWPQALDPSWATSLALPVAAGRAVARLAEDAARGHDVSITSEAIEGHPAAVLLPNPSATAVLAVGSRGHGGFAGALLGPVSQHVVAHARCLVVAVPDLPREAVES